MLSHDVYFTLSDASEQACQELVDSCRRDLGGIEGILHFSVGTRTVEFTREVNDSDFHVALHVLFPDRAAHDAYQEVPAHARFIEQNQANWAAVRVFDATVVGPA